MNKITAYFRWAAMSLCLAAFGCLSSGCLWSTDGPQTKAMTPVGFTVPRQHTVSVKVKTEGGTETKETGMPGVSAPAFHDALVAAIAESQVFSSKDPSEYLLLVDIVKSERVSGLTIHVPLSTHWQLTRLSDNRVLFNEFITTTGTATVGDAWGITRLSIALERASQENIRQGLTKLSELDLH